MNDVNFQLEPMDQDADAATDQMLFRDNITWSKGRLRRAKVMSMITGNKQPSRKKIFSEIRNSEDIQIWSINVHGMSIRCAKVCNPIILTKPRSNTWTELVGVQRLEIEDPEATQSTIPKQLVTELRCLESLSITWTKIKSLPSALFQLPLNSLYLQRNQIKTLNGIEKASELTILDISNNHLDCLPKTFGQLQSLVTLNLSGNGLHELPESVGLLSQLKTLDCSCNKLKSLPNSLGNIIELTSLDVSTNHLTSLPESVGSLPKLEDLRVRSNQLASLPDSFGMLNRLNSLLLRNNKFGEVPVQLSRLTNLQSLNMRENMIGHVDRPISSLKYLILDQNHLKQIDVGILQCPNLQYLSLKSNNLVEVTGSISKLANVRSLNLSDNAIAEIPAELDCLTHLHHLSLCSTKIRTVPLLVACIPSLKTLELDECSELDPYLSIAYKTEGLRGIIEHLKNNEAPRDAGRSVRIGGRSPEGGRIQSIYPSDDISQNASENKSVVRNVAGLSIVPGTSVTPPASEAMLQVEIGRAAPPRLVHVARQTLCPTERPAKPYKPPGLAADHHDQSRRVSTSGSAESASLSSPVQPASQLETVVESPTSIDDADVITTIPQFGDLMSSSATEPDRQQKQQQSNQDSVQTAAQCDTEVVVKKRDEPTPLDGGNTPTAGASRTSIAKPRPPTKKKPSRIAT